jgi:hypothetical protein
MDHGSVYLFAPRILCLQVAVSSEYEAERAHIHAVPSHLQSLSPRPRSTSNGASLRKRSRALGPAVRRHKAAWIGFEQHRDPFRKHHRSQPKRAVHTESGGRLLSERLVSLKFMQGHDVLSYICMWQSRKSSDACFSLNEGRLEPSHRKVDPAFPTNLWEKHDASAGNAVSTGWMHQKSAEVYAPSHRPRERECKRRAECNSASPMLRLTHNLSGDITVHRCASRRRRLRVMLRWTYQTGSHGMAIRTPAASYIIVHDPLANLGMKRICNRFSPRSHIGNKTRNYGG